MDSISFGHDIYDERAMQVRTPPPLVEQITENALEAFKAIATAFGLKEWGENTVDFVREIPASGTIGFFRHFMESHQIDGETYWHRWRKGSIFHKIDATVTVDYAVWRALGAPKKGDGQTTGGRELDALREAVGSDQPLSLNDSKQHSKMKSAVMTQNLSPKHVKKCAPAMFEVAEHIWKMFMTGEAFNASSATIQFVSRTNARSFNGPPGSLAEKRICPLMFKDGELNPKWSKVPEAVEVCGQRISDKIFLDPKWIAEQLASPFTRCLQALGFIDPFEHQIQAEVLRGAALKVMRESKKAADEPGEGPFETWGMIEYMFNPRKYKPDADATYSEKEIESITRLMWVVGQRTTSVAFEGMLTFLCLHPEWQDRLYGEMQRVMPDAIDFDKLHSMPLLHHFVWETLRLRPPVPLQTRELTEDVEYEGEIYKSGTMIAIAHLLAQLDPTVYDDPNAFNPDRWKIDGEAKASEFGPQRFSSDNPEMHTFSMTPHQCCGRIHALTVMKLALVAILRNARIEAEDLEEMRAIYPIGGFVLKHSAPVRLRLHPRTQV